MIKINKVECHVTSCQYYGENLCSLDKIRVDGPAAKDKSQTCCLSFDEKTPAIVNKIAQEPAIQTAIKCKAENCTFNSNAKCEADCICVDCSCANVSTKSGTECASFVER